MLRLLTGSDCRTDHTINKEYGRIIRQRRYLSIRNSWPNGVSEREGGCCGCFAGAGRNDQIRTLPLAQSLAGGRPRDRCPAAPAAASDRACRYSSPNVPRLSKLLTWIRPDSMASAGLCIPCNDFSKVSALWVMIRSASGAWPSLTVARPLLTRIVQAPTSGLVKAITFEPADDDITV